MIHKTLLFAILFNFLMTGSAYAQNKDSGTQEILKRLSRNCEAFQGNPAAKNGLAGLYRKIISSGSEADRFKAEAGLNYGDYLLSINEPNEALEISHLAKEHESGSTRGFSIACQLRSLDAAANIKKNDYKKGLKSYLEALKLAEQHRLAAQRVVILNNIAVLYIGMYDPANLPNTKKGLDYAAIAVQTVKELPDTTKGKPEALGRALINYGDLLNSYGADSKQPVHLRKALAVFDNAKKLLERHADTASLCQIYANKAYVYKNLGQSERYFHYLQEAYKLMHTGNVSDYVKEGIHFALGEYYYGTHNYNKAEAHLRDAEKILKADPSPDYQMLTLVYELGQKVEAARGNFREAYRYQSAYLNVKDSLLNAETLRKFEELEVQYQSERKGRQLKEAALQLENAHLMRNATFAVVLLLLLSLYLFYRSYTAKNKALLFKKEAADMALQKAESEIAAGREMLHRHTQSLVEKNHLIDELRQELLTSGKADDEALSRLSNSRILTREDWAEYKRLFDKVYPGFFLKLRNRYPDITEADERILAFSKLNISLKEAADLLGISYDSMKNSRYRLRKKMGIDTDTDFRDITAEL